MATLVARTQSILLNPSPSASPRHFPLSLPASPSTFPLVLAPSSSSSSSSVDHLHYPHKPRSSSVPDNPKRIRFAPLPVPDPNSNAVFLESDLSSQEPSPIPGSSQASFLPESALFANLAKEDDCQTPTELTPLPSFKSQSSSLPPSPTPGKNSFSNRLLKPLFAPWIKSPSNPLDDDCISRVSSRESSQSSHSTRIQSNSKHVDEFGTNLSRWTSSGSVSSYVSDSGRSLNRRPKSSFSTSSLNPLSRILSAPAPQQKHPSAKPGMRMLNGRIYGRRRPFSQNSTDPFANVKSQEPEFVEWGFGGMGSNKTNDHSGVGGRWKVVQGDGSTSTFGGRNAVNDDDASGMAWVRKRREQRERERLKSEQEAKEKNDPQSEHKPEKPQLASIKVESTQAEFKEEEKTPKFKTDVLPSIPTHTPHDSQEHITAVTLLPAAHKHHHPHTLKRDSSAYKVQPAIIQTPINEEPPGIIGYEIDLAAIAAEDSDKIPEHIGRDRSDSNGSASEEDSVTDGDDEDEEDTDSDSDSEDEEATRRTALGAGVEKISRHREHQNTLSDGIAHHDPPSDSM